MAIVQEPYDISGRPFIRTYSDAHRYVLGGVPYGEYEEANDPAELGRTYVEGSPIEDAVADPEEAEAADYEQALMDLGVRIE